MPSDQHRSGELYFTADRTRGPNGGGLGLASYLIGDVTVSKDMSPTLWMQGSGKTANSSMRKIPGR
ncbi:MAG: hypothetical protein ACR2IV_13130 [Bryobacteraceae bacterium]